MNGIYLYFVNNVVLVGRYWNFIDCVVFNIIFNLIQFATASASIYAFLEFFLLVLHTVFFQNHWLLSHIIIAETMESGERGINPVTMTIINLQTEYWTSKISNLPLPVLRFCRLPTELHSLT